MDETLPEFPKKRGRPRKVTPKSDTVVKEVIAPSPRQTIDYSKFVLGDDEHNQFSFPREMFPDGFDLQWVTDGVFGQHQPQRRSLFQKRGWQSVHVGDFNGRFDHLMPKGHVGEIIIDGLALVSRPDAISKQIRERERLKAYEQVRIKERQMMDGDIPGVGLDTRHETARRSNRLSKSWERINVPKD